MSSEPQYPSYTAHAKCPTTLEELLAPHDVASFLGEDWGRRFRHFDGPGRRFEGLMPWDALNEMLATVHFDADRLCVSQNGTQHGASTWARPGNRVHRWDPNVDAPKLERALANGATLVINSANVSFAPLRALCSNLETVFHTNVCANLYAAWRTDPGLDLHWDSQDLLIVQVHGKKRWTAWEQTVPHPSERRHLAPEHRPGEHDAPVFDDMLEAGQMLHIPRGFWHLPRAVDEPSLHLTVTMEPCTGCDVLHWIARMSQDSVAARMNVPMFASPEERRAWIAALRDKVVSFFDDDLLERYLADLDSDVPVAPRLDLPRTSPRETGRDLSARVRLNAPRPVRFRTADDGRLAFEIDGNEWKTTSSARFLLEALADGKAHLLRNLITEDREDVLDCVDALVADRILEVVSP
jgi:hypothetical protein